MGKLVVHNYNRNKRRATKSSSDQSNIADNNSNRKSSILFLLIIVVGSVGFLVQYLHNHGQYLKLQSISSRLPSSVPISSSLPISSPSLTPRIEIDTYNNSSTEIINPLSTTTNHILNQTQQALQLHPLFQLTAQQRNHEMKLEDILFYLHSQEICRNLPIFVSMANVPSNLYWQLIENFIYSMVKFDLISCSIMICVSDTKCMKKCEENLFPCLSFDVITREELHYDHQPSALEQIAALKLLFLPRALAKQVNIFTLDLDAGFLEDPRKLIQLFQESEYDICVQKDISFVMHRSKELWRTWYTVPLPNIGIMICKGNKNTVRVFNRAWEDYQTSDVKIRKNPGKDQNKVVNALYQSRDFLKWGYFPGNSTVLIDKIHKNEDTRIELGGSQAAEMLHMRGAIAAHATCYEKDTKMMALKAANAFWNPFYYQPFRRTITKPLIYQSEKQLQDELRTLVYLAMSTSRALIVPNILGRDEMDTVNLLQDQCAMWPGFRAVHIKHTVDDKRRWRMMGFLAAYAVNLDIEILEPAFYWRVERDYADIIPPPMIVQLTSSTVTDVEAKLFEPDIHSSPRVVLSVTKQSRRPSFSIPELVSWASNSVSQGLGNYESASSRYNPLAGLNNGPFRYNVRNITLSNAIIERVRPCARIFARIYGNRSCFDKCH